MFVLCPLGEFYSFGDSTSCRQGVTNFEPMHKSKGRISDAIQTLSSHVCRGVLSFSKRTHCAQIKDLPFFKMAWTVQMVLPITTFVIIFTCIIYTYTFTIVESCQYIVPLQSYKRNRILALNQLFQQDYEFNNICCQNLR